MANAMNTVCRDGFTVVNNKCLAVLPPLNDLGFTNLQYQCNWLGGNIVSIHTAIDNTAIAKFIMEQGYSEALWIGLTCYGPDNCIWQDQHVSSYNNFQTGNPFNGSCVQMIPSTGKWVSADCSIGNATGVCETDIIGTCSYKFGDSCYYPIAGKMFHNEALTVCEQMCSGSLVSIHSAKENEYISGLFIDPNVTSINIGAILNSSAINYWSDGSTWDFANLNYSSYDDGRYYSMSKYDGKWNSQNSFTSWFPSICKWKANSTCQATCTEPIYREETGTILSPNYPISYNKNRGIQPCYYVLHVPNGIAAIRFYSIDLDSKSSIELYSGTSENSTQIAVITQENQLKYKMKLLPSSSNVIKLVFNQCTDNCDVTKDYSWMAVFSINY